MGFIRGQIRTHRLKSGKGRVMQIFHRFASSLLFRICLIFIKRVAPNEHTCSMTIIFILVLCRVLCSGYFNF